MRAKNRWLDGAALAVIVAAVLLATAPFLWSNRAVPFAADEGGSDLLDLNAPHRYLLAEELKAGRLPIWRNDIGAGFPLLAEAQTGLLDPFQLVLFRWLPFVAAFNGRLLLALLTMGIGAYYCAKRLGQGQLGALVVALAFTLSGYSLGHLKHVQILDGIAYLPWVILAVESAVTRPGPGAAAGLAAALGLSALAGHLPTTVFLAFAAVVYALLRFALDPKTARERPAPYVVLAAGFAGALLVGGAQLAPSLEFLAESTRRFGTALLPIATFHPKFLLTLISPFVLGDPSRGTYNLYGNYEWWENAFTVGLAATLLAVLAVRRRDNPPTLRATLGLTAVGFLMVIGPISLLPRLLWYGFPGLTLTRVPSRFLFLLSWGLAVLAGFGAERLRAVVARRGRALTLGAALVLPILVAAPLVAMFRGYYVPWPWEALRTPPVTARWIQEHSDPGDRFVSSGYGPAWAGAWRAARGWRGSRAAYERANALLRPDLGALYGVRNIGFPNELLGAFSVARRAELGLTTEGAGLEQPYAGKLLGLQAVRYLLSPEKLNERAAANFDTPTEIPIPGDGPTPAVYVFPVRGYLPRVRIVGSLVEPRPGRSPILELARSEFHPGSAALVDSRPTGWADVDTSDAVVESVREEPRGLEVTVRAPHGGFLVVADAFTPGWEAMVDGNPAAILRTNYAFRGVVLPAGARSVHFTYAPVSLEIGAAASGLGVAGVLAGAGASAVAAGRRRWRQAPGRTRREPR